MSPAWLLPACQVRGSARPVRMGGSRVVGGGVKVNEKQPTGGWGGQSSPFPSGLRSVFAPQDPPKLYLRFAQMIIGLAGTSRPHPVTVGYNFHEAGIKKRLFIEMLKTKVLHLNSTKRGY